MLLTVDLNVFSLSTCLSAIPGNESCRELRRSPRQPEIVSFTSRMNWTELQIHRFRQQSNRISASTKDRSWPKSGSWPLKRKRKGHCPEYRPRAVAAENTRSRFRDSQATYRARQTRQGCRRRSMHLLELLGSWDVAESDSQPKYFAGTFARNRALCIHLS